jgi:dephospho-CoA kinase
MNAALHHYPAAIGVTGSMACGKTTVARTLVTLGAGLGHRIHFIECDALKRRAIEQRAPWNVLQKKLYGCFGRTVMTGRAFDRAKISRLMADDPAAGCVIEGFVRSHLKRALERELRAAKGIVLVEDALLAERGFLPLVGHRVLLVRCSEPLQRLRLAHSDLNRSQLNSRLTSQLSNEGKRRFIESAQCDATGGFLLTVGTDAWPTIRELSGVLQKLVARCAPLNEDLYA